MWYGTLESICVKRDGVESRSISAENPTGEKGKGAMADPAGDPHSAARELGKGWKVRPCIMDFKAGATVTLMDVDGPGVIRHIWMTVNQHWMRDLVLRVYWDGEETPSIETPLGDFFCVGWNRPLDIMAVPVNVNPHGGMNCYLPMPFRKHARVTLENIRPEDMKGVFYTINYTLEPVNGDALYLHAQWRRENPTAYAREYTILDGVQGQGQYVGTFLAWQQNAAGWWGEGEVKMFIDGDEEFPTICGTGTEDYFGGAWGFMTPENMRLVGEDPARNYTAPYMGFAKQYGEAWQPGARMIMYRFHVPDPVYFSQDLRVRIQALGWRSFGRFYALQDDISSVGYWYQSEPHAPFPVFPDRGALEVV